MENPLRKQIRSIMKDHKKRQMWYRIVTTLAVVVVFVTTYMLILPAITMENKAECGITEHKHDANCYSSHYEKEKELACTTDSLGVHKHTEACYDAEHKLICGYADFVIHEHDASCYDKDGNLVCTIPEHKLHQHTPECYQMQKQLVCTQEESAGHTHTPECYTKQGSLICGKEEHTHGEGCYDAEGNLICALEEHAHSDECYEWTDVLTCTTPESAGHTHSEACYQDVQVLICEEPAELHTHTAECYKDGVLACGKLELKEHKHSETCFTEKQNLVETLICDRVEHVHTDECYKKSTEETATSEAVTASQNEETSSEDESSETASIEETSTEENSSEETSTEETSSEETSSEEASSEADTDAEEQSTEASIEETSLEEASTEETSIEETSLEASSEDESETESAEEAESESEVESESESETEESSSIEAESEEESSEEVSTEEETSEEESFEETSTEETSEEELTSEEASTEEETSEAEEESSEEETSEAEEESSEEETSEAESETSFEYDINNWNLEVDGALLTVDKNSSSSSLRRMRRARSNAGAQASSTGIDFGQYITEIAFSKIENGYWVPVKDGEAIKEGSQVRFNISYNIPDGEVNISNKKIYYQLPSGVKLRKEESGAVYRNGVAVGTYTISPDGMIEIEFEDDFVADGKQFNGNIWFEGTVSASGTNENGEIEFAGEGGTLKIDKQEETLKNDISVEKSGSVSKDGKTVDYEVVASSKKGSGSPVTIEDYFRASEHVSATFDQNSFKIYKADDFGNQIEVNGYAPTFDKTWDSYPKFTLKDLPELKAGEKYIVKYTANISVDSSGNWDGAATVNNTAKATIKVENKETWSSIEISKAMISKTGGYDSDQNVINWTVTLNKGRKDIQGYTFSDTLPDGIDFIGTEFDVVDTTNNNAVVGKATVKADGSIEYTFGTDQPYTGEYRITYRTTAPDNNGKVTNTGTIGKDGTGNSSTAGVDVTHRNWGVSKNYKNEEDANNGMKKLTWSTTVSLPDSELEEFTYKDRILDASSSGDHYAVASELQKDIEKNFALQLSDDSKLTYNNDKVTLSVTYYDASENVIEPSDTTQKVKSFEIKITPKSGNSIKAKYMILDAYSTYADISQMQPGTSLVFKNKAELPEHYKDAESTHTIKKDKALSKQSTSYWDRDYNTPQSSIMNKYFSTVISEGSKEMTYDSLKDGYLYYRIVLQLEEGKDEDIVLEDVLPDGVKLDEASVEGWFLDSGDDYSCRVAYYPDPTGQPKYYDFSSDKKPTVSLDGQNMTITIHAGYLNALKLANMNQKEYKIAITYRVSIKDEWNDLAVTDKTYVNKVKWGSNSDSQTTTVTRPITKVEKTSAVEVEKDSNGNISAYYAAYSVVVNPTGANMNPYADTLTLSDTLGLQDGVNAYLDLEKTGLYYYDASKEDYRGIKVNSSRYTLKYDSETNVLNLVIPDETACVFVYRYRIECGSAISPTVTNQVKLYGKFSSSTSNVIHNEASGASVDKGSLRIYKVDSDDYTNLLPGAEFKIEKFNSESNTWEIVSDANHPDGKYVSDEQGEVELPKEFAQETLYRLQETKAPSGYSRLAEEIYFVFMKSDKNTTITNMNSIFSAASVNTDKIKFYETTNKDAILYVPNDNTEITVKKVWENKDGSILVNPPTGSILVTVYRQKQQLAKWTVTVNYQLSDCVKTEKYEVAKGSPFTITFEEWQVKNKFFNETEQQQLVERKDYSAGYEKNVYDYIIASVTSDMVVTIYESKGNQHDYGHPTPKYDSPQAYEPVSGSGEVAVTEAGTKLENVALTAAKNWTVSWSDLPKADSEKAPYYYIVKETVTIPGYRTTYLNNGGIQTGIIYITNQKEEEQSITLPETGGTGTYWYTMGGVLLTAGAAFLIYKKHMQKGGRRIW